MNTTQGDLSSSTTDNEYVNKVLYNSKCIIWKWKKNYKNERKADAKERSRRKAIKDQVGNENPEIPMLDSKQTIQGTVYCDAIFYSRDTDLWFKACQRYFKNYESYTKAIAGGKQMVICNEGRIIYTISFYMNVKKVNNVIMIQPGDRNENYVLDFIKLFPAICELRHTEREDGNLVSEDEVPGAARPDQAKAGSSNGICTKKLMVDLPPLPPLTYAEAIKTDARTHSKQTNTEASEHLIVDEVLFFIQNKLSVRPLTLDVLVRVCAKFYSSERILSSKKLLFNSIKQSRLRLIVRRGETRKQDDVMDMCKLLLSTELENMPTFVARDLLLIPCGIETCDASNICREIDGVKNIIKKLSENQESLAGLVHTLAAGTVNSTSRRDGDMAAHFRADSPAQSHSELDRHPLKAAHWTTCRDRVVEWVESVNPRECHAPRITPTPSGSAAMMPPPLSHSTPEPAVPPAAAPMAGDDTQGEDTGSSSGSSGSSSNGPGSSGSSSPGSSSGSSSTGENSEESSVDFKTVDETCCDELISAPQARRPNPRTNDNTDNRWQTQRNRRHKRGQNNDNSRMAHEYVVGKGLGTGLRSAKDLHQHQNKRITGLFVSKLHPKTSSAQLAVWVYHEFGFTVHPEKMPGKPQYYSSFYIPCDQNQRESLMNADMWPAGAFLKPFMQ